MTAGRTSPGAGPLTSQATDSTRTGLGRRSFLKRAGAGAIALGGAMGGLPIPASAAARSSTVSTSPTTFGRIFEDLPPFASATDSVRGQLAS